MNNITIIGCGPRGLAAIEYLMAEIAFYEPIDIKITVFDPESELGAGQVWNTKQSEANWINISLRALENLNGRNSIQLNNIHIPSFPSFNAWIEEKYGVVNSNTKDIYTKRSTMGKYLNERFKSISKVLIDHGILHLHKTKIMELSIEPNIIHAKDANGVNHSFDECLLAIGHQETRLDKQMKSWADQIQSTDLSLFSSPYDDQISKLTLHGSSIAVRGLGLSTIDVIRKLIYQGGGSFEKDETTNGLVFHNTNSCPKKIVPFSLDGLIAAPKPNNMIIDRIFEPSRNQKEAFEESLIVALKQPDTLPNSNFLINAFADSFVEKFSTKFHMKVDQMHKLVADWLNDPTIKHPSILDIDLDLTEYMRELSKMALGHMAPTLDYTIGQYWRWLQPSMYQIVSHSDLSDELMTEIISIDEKTKRYSYGPPVESTLQLIALAEDGILDLSLVNNPNIVLNSKGWTLSKGGCEVSCNVMINSVLSSPSIQNIKDGPIRSLVDNESMDIVSSDLGVSTRHDGIVLFNNNTKARLSVLGRNAKGSVMGVDAILECFEYRIRDWAYGVCQRMYN